MIPLNQLKNQRIDYLDDVIKLSEDAQNYLGSFHWCKRIINGWLSHEWGYILGIFYFEIEPLKESSADKFVWIVVGDLPSAYIDTVSATNALSALESYVFLMEDWIDQSWTINPWKNVTRLMLNLI